MVYNTQNPLIVQSDYSVLVEVDNPLYEESRDALMCFAELVKSPEHIHTYKITPLSIWNACAAGHPEKSIIYSLRKYSKYEIPEHVEVGICDYASRYGRVKIIRSENGLLLRLENEYLAEELYHKKAINKYIKSRISQNEFSVEVLNRGLLKQALIKAGFPAEDLAGYAEGEELKVKLRSIANSGANFVPRPYQWEASNIFYAEGNVRGGSGVIVMPCGSGKTIVGMTCMSKIQTSTLILTTSVTGDLLFMTRYTHCRRPYFK